MNTSKPSVFLFCALLVFSCQNISAAEIRIYSTGLDDLYNPLPNGGYDPHYLIVSAPSGSVSTPHAPHVTYTNNFPFSPSGWRPNDSASQWISATNGGYQRGTYIYRTTFSLAEYDHHTARISLRILSDNNVSNILINGHDTGISDPVADDNDYRIWSAQHTISNNFLPEINTIDFVLSNPDNISGLRVEISGVAEPSLRISTAVEIEWDTSDSVYYQIQWSTNLLSGTWNDMTGSIQGDGQTHSIFDSTHYINKRYYRIIKSDVRRYK